MLIEISKIKVSDRIRKDYGDIEDLAKDIGANGLINPIVLTPEFELIAGERRLRAHQFLGYTDIEANIMTVRDYEHQLQIEISENEHRKEFTYSERVDWGKRLEQVEKMKAKERMSGQENFPEHESGQVRDIVAEKAGFGSGKQFEKAKFILENATPEIVQQLDAGLITTHKAFTETKSRLEEETREANERADQAERDLSSFKKQYKNAIPMDQLDDAIAHAVELKQEENGAYLQQKEKEHELILSKRDKEWRQKLEDEKQADKLNMEQLRKGYERVKEDLEALKLNQPEDFDEKQQEALKKKLQYEADINTIQLRVQIKSFLEKAAISSLLIGSIAQTDSSEKMRLTASLEMLDSFTAQIKAALNGRKVVEKHVK
jgi:ParB family transcriptional regulator, chromosome partitioning protein